MALERVEAKGLLASIADVPNPTSILENSGVRTGPDRTAADAYMPQNHIPDRIPLVNLLWKVAAVAGMLEAVPIDASTGEPGGCL